ncbi:MAG: phage minor capsid protein, partial [Oscillospiraceae bacterium]|nr:phage minor capsid protein [Oscillospiraceae bacterium]
MMRDYEPDVSQILALYQQLEDDIISSMTKRMLKMGKVSEFTKYEAEILQTAGLLFEDVMELIAQRTDATKQHVKVLFEDAGVQTVSIDNQIHKQNGILPVDIRQDASLLQILEAGYKKTLGMMKNLVSTTANLAQTAFISACDRAYMQVSSGAFSYQQAIRQAVKSFGDTGAMVQYPSGHRDRMDVAVRRAVLTGVGQTSASVALQHAKNSDCKFMELTAHSGARPDHAAWQGQLVSLDGKNVGKIIDGLRVFSLDQIGYGTGAGFKGWNCRHNWHPYYVGLSTPNYTPEQLQALDAKNIEYNGKFYTEYEISQMQRAAERKVRALKRQVIASQTALENAPDDLTRAELQTDYTQNAVKLKKARKALQEFCKQTGRRNDTFRTQVEGFGRSQAQKAMWANKKDKILSSNSYFYNKFFGEGFKEIVDNAEKSVIIELGEVKKYGDEHAKQIKGYLANAPELIQKVWNLCASDFHNLGVHSKRITGYASGKINGVYLDIEEASYGSSILVPYESVFHEYGHHIDYILNMRYGNGDKYTAFSEVYKNGALGKKVKEEVQKTLSAFEKKLIDSGKYTSDTIPSREKIEKMFCDEMIKKFESEGITNILPTANIADSFESGLEF